MASHKEVLEKWKLLGYFSFSGLVFGILIITAVLPLTFVVMGEFDITLLAVHSGSLKMVGYWTIGMGGVTIICYLLSCLAALIRSKSFVIVAFILLILHLLATISIMILGTIPTDSHKQYFKDAWKGFNTTTANLIQKHYSCCGFESASEWNIKHDSCYAVKSEKIVWSQGCYDRVMSASVPASTVTNTGGESVSGSSSWNNFIAAYAIMFIILLIIDFLSGALYAYVLKMTDFSRIKNCSKMTPRLLLNIRSELNVITLEDVDNTTIPNEYVDKKSGLESNRPEKNNENGLIEIKTLNEKMESTATGTGIVNNGFVPSENSTNGNGMQNSTKNKEPLGIYMDEYQSYKVPWHSKISHSISHGMEGVFFWLGYLVGLHPKRAIVMSLIVTVALCFGLLQRRETDPGSAGFLPQDLQIIADYSQYAKFFTTKESQHKIIIENDNVLSNDIFQQAWDLYTKIKNMQSSTSMTFDSLCLRYNAGCGQESLFELWSYNDTDISAATDQSILDKIKPKNNLQSPYYGGKYLLNNVLGGQTPATSSSEEVQSAKAHKLIYKTNTTFAEVDWQAKFVKLVQSQNAGSSKLYVHASNSYVIENLNSYQGEVPLLFAGFGLVFIYISAMSGKFSRQKHRVVTGMLGVATAGMAMGAGIGFTATLQFEWTVLHLIGPFLIIGIGVDDMFILLQTWTLIDEDPKFKKESVEEKAGHVLKTAGVSITITSVTDLVAFAVGATSDLSAFESFSIYTSMCIILLFFFQCTFFMACTVLDQKRREQNRDACLCWKKLGDDYEEGKCASREIFQWVFENVIGYALEFIVVRVVVILVTLGLTGVMAWAFYKLEVSYNPDWYLPADSYVQDFNSVDQKYFESGQETSVYVLNADFYNERDKLEILYNKLSENSDVDNEFLKSWYHEYQLWPSRITNPVNASEFYADVDKFLKTASGNQFTYNVIYDFAKARIVATQIELRHQIATTLKDAEIMDSIRKNVAEVNFTGSAFPYTWGYFNLEITKIIAKEVYRNIGITLACVFVVVFATIASLQMSIWVGFCVVFTIVDVAGTMYFAGLYIESSTIITLLLTVGLAVDYAAHIGHKFLTLKGSRILRMRVSLSHVGPAVFNGGFSTFLAISLMAFSRTYSTKVFFTVFTCVVWFGLWNGLIFLPSLLAFIGPHPHKSAHDAHLSDRARIRQANVSVDLEKPENTEIKRI